MRFLIVWYHEVYTIGIIHQMEEEKKTTYAILTRTLTITNIFLFEICF